MTMDAPREICIQSLESILARYDDSVWGDHVDHCPEGLLDEYEALLDGRAVLILPTGTRYWLPVSAGDGRANLDGPLGEALLSAVLDHMAIAGHEPCEVFFEQETNALTAAYCLACGRLVDLTEDVRKMDEEAARDTENC